MKPENNMTEQHPPLLSGLNEIVNDYDALILDIWGVLHDGIQPFPGTLSCLEQLRQEGKQTCLVSNTPNNSASVIEMLENMRISRDLYDQIITAGDSAFRDIKSHYQGQTCWYAGTQHLSDMTAGLDIAFVDHPDKADFMINDLYRLSDTEKAALLPLLRVAADKDLKMICGNPDLVVNYGNEIHECPGTYALLYEEMGGPVIYHGKPHGPIYETAWDLLGKPDKSRMAAIGDSLHTDIQGANTFGIHGIFNLAGIHRQEVLTEDQIDPTKLHAMIDNQPHRPDIVLNGFRW